jgi:hypothetical protein
MERAVAAELANTATIITHTGIFDNIDKLYKTVSGSTTTPPPAEGGEMGGELGGPPPGPPGPPPGPPPGGEMGGLPESKKKLENLILESDDDYFTTNSSLGEMENELLKILRD